MIARPVRLMRALIVPDMVLHGTGNSVSYEWDELIQFSSFQVIRLWRIGNLIPNWSHLWRSGSQMPY